jgi:glycosyltransferase involved in cell wall biosynthesis
VKVLHVNTERTWRGGEQQVLYLMRGLRAAGLEQELLARPESAILRRAQEDGLPATALRMRGEVDVAAARAIAARLRAGRYDVVHMHTSHAHTLGAFAARLAGRRRRGHRPVTVVSRRVDFSIHKRRLFDFSRLKYTWGVDRIVCVSEMIRRVLVADGLPPELLAVVHSGVDLARFVDVPDRSADYRRELGVPPGAAVIGNVAHCADHKGQRDLIAAAPAVLARHPQTRFVIVGEGELLPALKAQAQQLGIADRVLFPGFRTDVPSLLLWFDVFCFPSRQEGLGTSVLDALAMAKPVVATTAGGIPEMIASGEHGLLVPPADPAALGEALAWMLEHRAEAETLGVAGRLRAEREFSVERTVAGTLAQYEELLARGPASRRA